MTIDELMGLWEIVDDACDRVACALPSQIGDAADRLERSRKEYRQGLMLYARKLEKSGS